MNKESLSRKVKKIKNIFKGYQKEMNKIYRAGDIVATIKEKEIKEIEDLAETKVAIKQSIRDLMKTLVDLEKENIQNQAEWWKRIKKKYKFPLSSELRKSSYLGGDLVPKVSKETRELFIGVTPKEN